MGEKIADVECCPSESNCGNDFKFRTSAQKECTYSYECDNAGELFGITQTTAGYYVCESGKCVNAATIGVVPPTVMFFTTV